jgi:signal transduction histidine kinase
LEKLIRYERDHLLHEWRSQVRQLPVAKHLDIPTLNDHIPKFLEELCNACLSSTEVTIPEALREVSPLAHGLQRIQDGFDIEEIVAEYNILRACIHDLAENASVNLQGRGFRVLNRVFDGAIASAVQAYAMGQALEVKKRREEYLAFVVHDLRTPLNAISLSASVLQMTIPSNVSAEASTMLKTLHRNIEHLDRLVRKIIDENNSLETEAGVELQRRILDLWPLVQLLIRDLQPVADANRTQLINRVPHELSIYADANLLMRVLQNLIANAIKYTPDGDVTISASELEADGSAECLVVDNGKGIPESQVLKVFDKGETDLENVGGMGIGLAIVKKFVEAHGGTVSVESELNVGSTFRFSLPAKKAEIA